MDTTLMDLISSPHVGQSAVRVFCPPANVLLRLTLDERFSAEARSAAQLHCGAMQTGVHHDQTSEALGTHNQAEPMRRHGQAHAVAGGSDG
jgi:hypothetical protein